MPVSDAKWLRITFRVDAQYYDNLSNLLEACLALAVTIENAGEGEFLEVAFPQKPNWKQISVSALFFESVDAEKIIQFVNNTLFVNNPVPAVVERFADENWERVWLDQFKPIHVAGDMWICPSWHNAPEASKTTIYLDPGLAFGTGTHETTFLCLQWLAKNDVSNKTVLDYGAGSGILAIAALLKGASRAVAVDIDPLAVQAAQENALKNAVDDKLQSILPEQLPHGATYDIVIANILADVLIEQSNILLSSLATHGIMILSGLLKSQVDKVKASFQGSLDIEEIILNDWVVLIGVKK